MNTLILIEDWGRTFSMYQIATDSEDKLPKEAIAVSHTNPRYYDEDGNLRYEFWGLENFWHDFPYIPQDQRGLRTK